MVGLAQPAKEHPSWSSLPPGEALDPRAFNPDRWLTTPGLDSPLGVLNGPMLNFGVGQRYCLGANLAWAEIKAGHSAPRGCWREGWEGLWESVQVSCSLPAEGVVNLSLLRSTYAIWQPCMARREGGS